MPSIIMPKKDLVLASGSESRKIMLTEAGLDFSVKPSSVDESVITRGRRRTCGPNSVPSVV